jgi:hypothetical protein
MPKLARELSPIQLKRLEHPGHGHNATFAVGGVAGLLLQITPNGGRTWILRAQVGDKRREMGLGGYPDVTLAQARERAREAKEQVWQGATSPRPRTAGVCQNATTVTDKENHQTAPKLLLRGRLQPVTLDDPLRLAAGEKRVPGREETRNNFLARVVLGDA